MTQRLEKGNLHLFILPDLQMIVVTASKLPYGNNRWEEANQQEEAVLQLVGDCGWSCTIVDLLCLR